MDPRNLLNALEQLEGIFGKRSQRGEGKVIGKLSPELLKRHQAMGKKEDELQEDCELEQKKMAIEVKRRLEAMFDERIEAASLERTQLWREIEASVDQTEDADLSVNSKTGVITLFEKKQGEEEEKDNLFTFRPRN